MKEDFKKSIPHNKKNVDGKGIPSAMKREDTTKKAPAKRDRQHQGNRS